MLLLYIDERWVQFIIYDMTLIALLWLFDGKLPLDLPLVIECNPSFGHKKNEILFIKIR